MNGSAFPTPGVRPHWRRSFTILWPPSLRPDGAVLGYAGLHAVIDEGYLDNIAVRADYRGNGIADDLLDVFVRFGREHLAFLTLEVRPTNEPAIQLYYKHGFAQVGRRKDYYQHPREDAIIMTLEFGNGTETAE